jgi:nucleotide-binding universal stress UspA family protein
VEWIFVKKGHFHEGLYEVPHDALVVAGAYGHGLIREMLLGNLMEEIQKILPNNMVIVGPHYSEQ